MIAVKFEHWSGSTDPAFKAGAYSLAEEHSQVGAYSLAEEHSPAGAYRLAEEHSRAVGSQAGDSQVAGSRVEDNQVAFSIRAGRIQAAFDTFGSSKQPSLRRETAHLILRDGASCSSSSFSSSSRSRQIPNETSSQSLSWNLTSYSFSKIGGTALPPTASAREDTGFVLLLPPAPPFPLLVFLHIFSCSSNSTGSSKSQEEQPVK